MLPVILQHAFDKHEVHFMLDRSDIILKYLCVTYGCESLKSCNQANSLLQATYMAAVVTRK